VDGKAHDWFELYNGSPADIDLSGYVLSNSLTNKTQFPIPSGYQIPANGFLLVWADNNSSQNSTNDPSLHISFKLSASGESIALFTPNGALVDGVTFGPQTNDISQGRWPDGAPSPFVFMTGPTPGLPNTIGGTNSAPRLNAIANQTVALGSSISLAITATDRDANQTLTFILADGAPSGSSINPSSGIFNFTPGPDVITGVYPVTVTVTDNGFPALSDSKLFTITVTNPAPTNSPPVLSPIGNQSVALGGSLAVAVSATDPDANQTLTYSLNPGAPNGAAINAGSGLFTFTPGAGVLAGGYPVTVTVTDNGTPPLSDSKSFTVTVTKPSPTNSPPVISPIADRTVALGSSLSFNVVATDPDPNQTLTYGLNPGAPNGAAIKASSGLFTFTPGPGVIAGAYPVTLTVTDNGAPPLSDSKSFTITVTNPAPTNSPPVLSPITNRTVRVGASLSFTVTATDPDANQTLTYGLNPVIPNGAVINPTNGLFTFVAGDGVAAGDYPVSVTVTDNGAPPLSDTKSFIITITNPVPTNLPPVLSLITNRTVSLGGSLTFTVTATDPNANQTLTYSLNPGAPSGASLNSTNGAFSFTSGAGVGTYPITVTVTDNGSPPLSDSTSFTITVTNAPPANSPPVLNPIADRTVALGGTLSFLVTATDPDANQTLTFGLNPGAPAGAAINPDHGVFSFAPGAGIAAGTYPVTVTVIDNGAPPLSDSKTFTITVTNPAAFRLSSVSIDNSRRVTLTWSSQPQATYAVLFKTDLSQTTWQSLAQLSAVGSTLSFTDASATDARRFYIVQQVNP